MSVHSGCNFPDPQFDKAVSAAIQKSAPFQTEKGAVSKLKVKTVTQELAILSFSPTRKHEVLFQVMEALQEQILNS
jgi:hypothetical protein